MNNKREKVFYIVMIIFFALAPFCLFFNVFDERKKLKTIDGTVETVITKYNIVNIKDISTFSLIISILFIILSLTFAVFLIIDLYKNNYYRTRIKVLSGVNLVIFSGLLYYFSIALGTAFFMIVCCNLFMLSFDLKLNKNRKKNLLIYVPTYILFLLMIIISIGINTYL